MSERLPEGFSLDLSDPDLPALVGPAGPVARFGPNFSWPHVIREARERSWILVRVHGGAWLEGRGLTREEARSAAEEGNVEALRFGLPWRFEVREVS